MRVHMTVSGRGSVEKEESTIKESQCTRARMVALKGGSSGRKENKNKSQTHEIAHDGVGDVQKGGK